MKLTTPILTLLTLAAFSMSGMGAISIFVSPNDVESAEDSGILSVTTETFNSASLGTVNGYSGAIGNYTTAGTSDIQPHDQYGGDAEGNYLGVDNGQTVTITLASNVEYFGFYFTAGNNGNIIELYEAGTLVASFDTAGLVTLLNGGLGTIQAVNGSLYNTADYFGQPGTNLNGNEPYAYLHFFASGGTKFDEIRLSETGGAIFENDNHSIVTLAPVVPDTLVPIAVIPEPSSALFGLLSLAALGVRRRH